MNDNDANKPKDDLLKSENKSVDCADDNTDNSTNTTFIYQSAEPSAKSNKSAKFALLLSVVAIAAALGSAYFFHNELTKRMDSLNTLTDSMASDLSVLREENKSLQTQLTEQAQVQSQLKTIRSDIQNIVDEFDSTQRKRLKEIELQSETANAQLLELQQKVDRLATQDNSVWLISQADFYLKMAARRLWSERDVLTAIALLRAADQSLAQLNDSSLIQARSAISEDIAALAALNAPDTDGIVATLASMANQIDKLPLNGLNQHLVVETPGTEQPTESVADWRENLAVNWRSFTQNFISVRSVDDASQPLLSADQVVYLRENIRARILLAAQAVSRQQQAIYQDSLEQILAAINAQFDLNDAQTIHFIEELNQLLSKKLVLELPKSFNSAPIIEQLVEQRVKSWVTNPTIPSVSATQPSVTESQSQLPPKSVVQTESQP